MYEWPMVPRAVGSLNLHGAGNAEAHMVALAGVGLDHRLDALGPAPAWREGETPDGVVTHGDQVDLRLVRPAFLFRCVVGLNLQALDQVGGTQFEMLRHSRTPLRLAAWIRTPSGFRPSVRTSSDRNAVGSFSMSRG